MTFDTRGAAVIVLALAVGVAILVGVAKRFVVLSLYWRILLGVWILLELTFFAVQRLRYRRFNRRNTNVPRAHLKDIRKRFDDFLTLAPVLDLREFLSGWFLGIAADNIRQDNLSEFLSYAYWFQPFEELSEEDQQVVRSFNQQLQTTFNVQFPEGSNPDLHLMQHLWEPLRVVHKPLMLHLVSEMSTCCTHLLLQALRFERHEFMGFTYWAHGLQPLAPEEVPAGSRKLSVLQSLFVDLHSLLNSDDQGGPGPMDFLSAQAQGIAEYQKRLHATLNDVMMPPTFEDSFSEGTSTKLLPDISAALAAFSEHMPSVPMPQIPQLPRLSSMTASRPPTGDYHTSNNDIGVRDAFSGGLSLPRVLSMPSLSGLYAFRDLARDGFSNFEDFETSLATGLPSLTRNVRQTVSGWSSQAAAVRGALVAALPVLNLPDWRLGSSVGLSGSYHGSEVLPWQERVGTAATRVVQHMELDKLFANVFQDSRSLDDTGLVAESGTAQVPGTSRAASGSLQGSPLSQHYSTSFMEEWVRSASRAAHGGHRIIARFSGFSMPTPSQLLPPSLSGPLWAAFGLRGGAQRLAGVQPDAAAALRRAVEGSVLQRSAGARRSNPDLFGLPTGASTLSAQGACTSPQRRRVGLRLRELRDEDGNRFCRSVHVTAGRELPQAGALQNSSLLQQTSPRSPTRTAQLTHAQHASKFSIPSAPEIRSADASDAGNTCGLSRRNPLASHHSVGALHDAARTEVWGWDREMQHRLHGDQPCLRTSVAGSSVFQHPSSPPSRSTVAAHPVDYPPTASGGSAYGWPAQATTGSSSVLSEAQASDKTANTPTSTTGTPVASQAEHDCNSVQANIPARLDRVAELQGQVPEVSAGTKAEYGRGKSSCQKPPLAAVPSTSRQEGRHSSAQPRTKANTKQGEQKKPLVFLHGVGFGVLPYLGWVWKLLTAFPVLQRHGIQQANFIGHSFGTFVVAHMRKLFPETVSSVLLCDPVCMLTCFPKLLYNFIYRGVSFRDLVDDPVEMARWLVARDLCIASTFCRHFFWHTLMLWPWELPDATVLVLSTRDALVPSELVKKQLENGLKGARAHKVRVLEKELHHGYFLFLPKWQDTIIKTYKDAVDEAEIVHDVPVRRQRRRSSNGVKEKRSKRVEVPEVSKQEAEAGVVENSRYHIFNRPSAAE